MKRIRKNNINTGAHFDCVFKDNFCLYDSYKNIEYYNRQLNLGIFSGDSYLDYGCGNGNSLAYLKMKYPNINICGADISLFVIQENKKLFPGVAFVSIDDLNNQNIKFDHILSSHTLEHVENPLDTAQKLLEMASSTLTIIVPYKDSWSECEEHVWKFDKRSFKKLKPSLVVVGLTNEGGNAELLYYWNKSYALNRGFIDRLTFFFKKQSKQNLKGLLKKVLKNI